MAFWEYKAWLIPQDKIDINSLPDYKTLLSSDSWSNKIINFDISNELNGFTICRSWDKNIKVWSDKDNKISVHFCNPESSDKIFEIELKVDLRNPSKNIIEKFSELGRKLNCYIISFSGNKPYTILSTEAEKLKEDIKKYKNSRDHYNFDNNEF